MPGGMGAKIYLDSRYVGFQFYSRDAARVLATGGYDDELGFSASETGVPSDTALWVDPLDALDLLK